MPTQATNGADENPDLSALNFPFDQLLQTALDGRRASSRLRQTHVIKTIDSTHAEIDGRRLVNFCSNDYLGLSHHPAVIAAMQRAAAEFGAGAGAAPLISGYSPAHASAETAIARWKKTESARLLPSGYQANLAAVQTVAGVADANGRRVRFILDKLAHASLIDAVRGCGCEFRIFPHNNLAKLKRLLDDAPADQMQVVVTESIFSMDGDAAPLRDLAAMKHSHDFILLLDEAHASGVCGADGSGLADELGVSDAVDISVVTLSKSLGCCGGAVCASRRFCDALTNFGRAYVFSTSVPPAIAAAAQAAIDVIRAEPDRQARLRELSRGVRAQLGASGMAIPPGDSPIVPIALGSESRAIAAADLLKEKGFLIFPVRPPTVPPAASRLRVTLSCAHRDAEIRDLLCALIAMNNQLGH